MPKAHPPLSDEFSFEKRDRKQSLDTTPGYAQTATLSLACDWSQDSASLEGRPFSGESIEWTVSKGETAEDYKERPEHSRNYAMSGSRKFHERGCSHYRKDGRRLTPTSTS